MPVGSKLPSRECFRAVCTTSDPIAATYAGAEKDASAPGGVPTITSVSVELMERLRRQKEAREAAALLQAQQAVARASAQAAEAEWARSHGMVVPEQQLQQQSQHGNQYHQQSALTERACPACSVLVCRICCSCMKPCTAWHLLDSMPLLFLYELTNTRHIAVAGFVNQLVREPPARAVTCNPLHCGEVSPTLVRWPHSSYVVSCTL